MREPRVIFLDANILFSAALGGPAFGLLLELGSKGSLKLTTSRECLIEARTNISTTPTTARSTHKQGQPSDGATSSRANNWLQIVSPEYNRDGAYELQARETLHPMFILRLY